MINSIPRPRSTRIAILFSLLVIAGSGCGVAKRTAHAPVFPVEGKITYEGQPVVGADVTFCSDTADRCAFGRTDDQGVYHLTTFNVNDGAVEGKQTVTVVKFVNPPPTTPEADTESPDYIPPGYGPPPKEVKLEGAIPAKYGDANTSGLIVVVATDGENVFDFELTD